MGEARPRAEPLTKEPERAPNNRRKTADLDAKEAALKARAASDEETRRRRREIEQIEQRVLAKEEELARKLHQLERRLTEFAAKERDLGARDKALGEKEGRLATALEEQKRKLEMIADRKSVV